VIAFILAKYTPIHLHTPKTDTSVHISQPIYDAHHDTNTFQVDSLYIFNEKHYKNFKNEIMRHTEIYQMSGHQLGLEPMMLVLLAE